MNISKRRLWGAGGIAIAAIVLLTLAAAPNKTLQSQGSTYSRSPDGYGAWYAYMQERGVPVQRWQQPFEELPGLSSQNTPSQAEPASESKKPITLLRVNSQLRPESTDSQEQDWIKKGNTLVILGASEPVSAAEFSTVLDSPAGGVKIETRRRRKESPSGHPAKTTLLGDFFGDAVWQEKIGKGRIVWATTPHLAANAYQNEPGNYEFLAQLVTQNNNRVWVDEYIHGYRNPQDSKSKQTPAGWLAYLAKTPLLAAFLQAGVMLFAGIWAGNRRFGQPQPLEVPATDSSTAYIQALAGVLEKAESREFILEAVGKEQQLQLQKALGLGPVLLEPQVLADAWARETGRPAAQLLELLQLHSQKRRISERDLLTWLRKWQWVMSRD
ncbi:DUF4350 domain-containing protein [Kamptonema formosum]|uniref:DUF4350 domain-containing protein n=1 Tax=Kamptonema formosum TaxID=331992 RepID=UPI00034BAA7A|nr:DUF4350 domain-containing protein [Oscillatoria sp. PCC 10802]